MSVHLLAEGAGAIVKQSKVQVAHLESRNKNKEGGEKMVLACDCSDLAVVNVLLCFLLLLLLLLSVQKEVDLLFSSSTEGRLHEPETYLIVSAQNNMFARESNRGRRLCYVPIDGKQA